MKNKALILILFLLCSPVIATEFPTGTFEGIGFTVEKGSMKITQDDMYKHESSITITKLKEDEIQTVVTVFLQKTQNSTAKQDKRLDAFKINWISDNSGSLTNKNNAYIGDKTNFIITEDALTLKSWIARNQLLETHIYSLK